MEFDIRFSEMDDLSYLKKWMSHSDNMQWFPIGTPKEMETMTKNWIGFSKFRASITAIVENKPVGIATIFLMPFIKLAHQASFYVIVEKKYRKQGIGFSLVKNILHLGKTRFRLESMNVEVFEGCPLISILKRQDFKTFATQQDYCKSQGQKIARILMEHTF